MQGESEAAVGVRVPWEKKGIDGLGFAQGAGGQIGAIGVIAVTLLLAGSLWGTFPEPGTPAVPARALSDGWRVNTGSRHWPGAWLMGSLPGTMYGPLNIEQGMIPEHCWCVTLHLPTPTPKMSW